MLWYAYSAWTSGARWPAKTWSVLLVIAAATVVHVAVSYHLISFRTHY